MGNENSIDLDKGSSFIDVSAGEHVNIKTSTIVKMYETFTVVTEEGPVSLNVTITADFNEIPKRFHEIFLNVLTSKYMNKVNFGTNPFSECKPVQKKKWWQFWKTQYFTN